MEPRLDGRGDARILYEALREVTLQWSRDSMVAVTNAGDGAQESELLLQWSRDSMVAVTIDAALSGSSAICFNGAATRWSR